MDLVLAENGDNERPRLLLEHSHALLVGSEGFPVELLEGVAHLDSGRLGTGFGAGRKGIRHGTLGILLPATQTITVHFAPVYEHATTAKANHVVIGFDGGRYV